MAKLPTFRRIALLASIALSVLTVRIDAGQQPPQIPLVPGLKITFAVHVPEGGPAAKGIAQGDYI
jgi:hypothetical protein